MSKYEGHSEGPWEVYATTWLNIRGHAHLCQLIGSKDDTGIAIVVMPREDDSPSVRKERRATAELIAAAPNLLAQRDRLVEALEGLLCGAEFTLTNPRKPNDGPAIPAEMNKDEFEGKRVVIAARAALASVKESQ